MINLREFTQNSAFFGLVIEWPVLVWSDFLTFYHSTSPFFSTIRERNKSTPTHLLENHYEITEDPRDGVIVTTPENLGVNNTRERCSCSCSSCCCCCCCWSCWSCWSCCSLRASRLGSVSSYPFQRYPIYRKIYRGPHHKQHTFSSQKTKHIETTRPKTRCLGDHPTQQVVIQGGYKQLITRSIPLWGAY